MTEPTEETNTPPESATPSVIVDARGKLCPLPIIDLARAAKQLNDKVFAGDVIELWADDPAASPDVAAWCQLRNAELLSTTTSANPTDGTDYQAFRIRVR